MTDSRPRLRLLARGWAVVGTVLVLGPFGVWAQYPALIGLALALAGLLAVEVAVTAAPAAITVKRTVHPVRVARNDPCAAVVTVGNRSRRRWITVAGYDAVAGQPLPFRVAGLGPGEYREVPIEVPTTRRGVIRLGPLTVRRLSPAELVSTEQEYGSAATVVVEPRILDGGRLPPGAIRGHVGADERVDKGGTDLVDLREYVPGDDLRRLHWATSARSGTLMIREDADPSMPHLTVILDDRAAAYGGDEFEEAVDLTATLLDAAVRGGSPAQVVLVSGAEGVRCPAQGGGAAAGGLGRAARDALVALAPLAPSESGPMASVGARVGAGEKDVLVGVTGAREPLTVMLGQVQGASFGAVAVVDERPERLVGAAGAITVLRGPHSSDLAFAWRQAVAR